MQFVKMVTMMMLIRLIRSEIGRQEKMDKLVSVSNTVEHSSTIISDILSRYLPASKHLLTFHSGFSMRQ